MALHVLDEANRCLGCKKPLCQQGCPIHTNIPEVIRLLKTNPVSYTHLDVYKRRTFISVTPCGTPFLRGACRTAPCTAQRQTTVPSAI